MKFITFISILLSFLSNSICNSQSFDFGVNLAGAEFDEETMPGTLDQEYTYPNAAELDYYKSKGLKLIRLPFRWERLQHEFGGSLETENLSRIKEFVQMITERDMYVILDLHNYGRYRLNNTDIIIGANEQVSIGNIKDFWIKFADAFKNETNIWGYGIMNEPHDMLTNTSWFSIAQEIINGIRSVDTKTTIVVGGDSWSSAERWQEESDNLKNLVDASNKIIYEAHVYFDADAGGFYGSSYDDEGASPNTGISRVQPFIDWLKDNNLRGFIGEYGVPDDDARWLITLDNFLLHLKDNCINGTYWAGGPRWGSDKMAIDPTDNTGESDPLNGIERPQMSIVEKYVVANNTCTNVLAINLFNEENEAIKIYPNPSKNKITIEYYDENFGIKVLNSLGQQVLVFSNVNNSITINIKNLTSGIYFIQVSNAKNKFVWNSKMIKN